LAEPAIWAKCPITKKMNFLQGRHLKIIQKEIEEYGNLRQQAKQKNKIQYCPSGQSGFSK
jgi:hypothetical protein